MTRSVLFVAIGGMIGSVFRFLTVSLLAGLIPVAFPVGTFIVNVIGSFVIGAAAGLAERYAWIDHDWKLFLTVGFCGGFTTFSAFAFENVQLLSDKNYVTFASYSVASVVFCIGATVAGLLLTRN